MKLKNKIRIGVIADDFTGASDAASFLGKGGASTILLTKIPNEFNETCECIVIALKSRSCTPQEAIYQSKEAIEFLKKVNVECIYFKYCSTFDSIPTGNIGVTLDFILEYLQVSYTLLCPALPVNGRTVKNGVLSVFGVPLNESSMKHHPLNPMWDSYIPNLMKNQSHYPCFIIKKEHMTKIACEEFITELKEKYEKFYLIPDYETNEDAKDIATLFKTLPVLSGGSGLLEYLVQNKTSNRIIAYEKPKKALLLCGSCSAMSRNQIHRYCEQGGITYPVNSKELLNQKLTANGIFEFIKSASSPVLVYSDAIDKDILTLSNSTSFLLEANLMEKLMADLSELARDAQFDCIIVAGGETSGAVTLRLGYDRYQIGNVIAHGVPVMLPIQNKKLKLILKSGNFGNDDFFQKALDMEDIYAK